MSPTVFRAIGAFLLVLVLALLFIVSEYDSSKSSEPVNAQPQGVMPESSDEKEMKNFKID